MITVMILRGVQIVIENLCLVNELISRNDDGMFSTLGDFSYLQVPGLSIAYLAPKILSQDSTKLMELKCVV